MEVTTKVFGLLFLVCGLGLNANAQLSLTGDAIVEQGDQENYRVVVNFLPSCSGILEIQFGVEDGKLSGSGKTSVTLYRRNVSSFTNLFWNLDVDWVDNISAPVQGKVESFLIFTPAFNAPANCQSILRGRFINVLIDDD